LAGGNGKGWKRRLEGVFAMLVGAGLGALAIRHSVFLAMAIASGISLVCTATLAFVVSSPDGPRVPAA